MNLKDYFSFTRGEKRGVVILLSIILLLIIAIPLQDYLKVNQQTNFSTFEKKINAFEKERTQAQNIKSEVSKSHQIQLFEFNPNTISDSEWIALGFKDWQIKAINNYKNKGGNWKTKNDVKKIYGLDDNQFEELKPYILLPDENIEIQDNSKIEKELPISYFKFNPNTITKKQWKELGFKDWQIKIIFNYKSKGGSWKIKTDVKKIYGLSETDYNKLEPYILLPNNIEKNQNQNTKQDFTAKVDINKASAKDFMKLKGIYSEKYAAIIVKYRNSLGGFVNKEQLKEVWGMKPETYSGFENQLTLNKINPKQININVAKADEMRKHPYINWNIANAIEKYRNIHGNFKHIDDIKNISIIDSKTYLKIVLH